MGHALALAQLGALLAILAALVVIAQRLKHLAGQQLGLAQIVLTAHEFAREPANDREAA